MRLPTRLGVLLVLLVAACTARAGGGGAIGPDDVPSALDGAPDDVPSPPDGAPGDDAPAAPDGVSPVDVPSPDATVVDVAGCTNTCTAATCVGTALVPCERGADGCMHPATARACPSGQGCLAGACVAGCPSGCPDGFACGPAGACRPNDATRIALNVVTTTVSGQVTVNGAAPMYTSTAVCTPTATNDRRATVRFYDAARGYSFAFVTTGCAGVAPFTGLIYPGTYRVSVEGSGYSNVPATAQVIEEALVVGATGLGGVRLDVRTATVSGDLTVNGTAPMYTSTTTCTPTAANDRRATIRFTEITRGYAFAFSTTGCAGTAAFTGTLFPGTYRVTAEGSGYSNVPAAAQRVLDMITIGPAGASGVHLGLVTTTVSGQVTVNGAAPMYTSTAVCTPTAANDRRATIRFSEPTRGYAFTFSTTGCAGVAPFTGPIYPGTYTVTVEGSGYSDVPPSRQTIEEGLVVGPTGLGGLRLDVRTATVSGDLTVNGTAPMYTSTVTCTPTATNDRRATVRFYDAARGYSFAFVTTGCAGVAPFTGLIYPGTYRVSVEGSGYSNVPATPQRVLDMITIGPAGASNVHLGVVTTTVSGQVTVNSAPPEYTSTTVCTPTATNDRRATVRFVDLARGYVFAFSTTGCAGIAPFTGTIYPGTYRVTVEGSGYSNVPPTTQVVNEGVVVGPAGTGGLRFDVITRTVGGTVTVNGAPPVYTATSACTPTATNDRRAILRFTELTRGYLFGLYTTGCTGVAPFTGTVFPGVYRVTVEGSGFSNVPATAQTVLDRIEIP